MRNKFILLSLLAFAPISMASCSCAAQEEKEEPKKTEISFENAYYTLYEDDMIKLKVNTNSTKNIEFLSSNSDIASISSDGLVIAKKPGDVVISASVEGVTANCNISVKDLSEKKTAYISLEENSFTLGLNETELKKINPTFYDADGNIQEKTFTFSSLDNSIVSVNSEGILTPHKIGTCFVSVNADNVETRVFVDTYTMTIKTPSDWLEMLTIVFEKDARYTVLSDLDFTDINYVLPNEYDENWNMVMFSADIKGNGHVISNITFANPTDDISLFGFATHLQVSNLTFKNVVVDSLSSVKFGVCKKIMRHITEVSPGGESTNVIYTTLFSNVIFDIHMTSNITFTGFARDIYGVGAENCYFNIVNLSESPIKQSKIKPFGETQYLWWDGSFLSNIVYRLDGLKDYSEPSHSEGYTLKQSNICITDQFIEANYFASQHFNMNIWNIVPNDIPTLNK